MTIIETLNKLINEKYKGKALLLSKETGVKYDVILRIAANPNHSATTRNVQKLIDHFGLVIVQK